MRSNLAFLGCVSLWVVIFRQNSSSKWRDTILAVLVPCILITPWVWRNHRAFHGSLVFSTQGGYAAIAGVLSPQGRAHPGEMDKVEAAVGLPLSAALETNAAIRLRLPAEPEIDRRCWHAAFHAWRLTGWRLVPLTLDKLAYFWLSTDQVFWTEAFSRTQRLARAMGVFAYWLVLALGVTGWLRLRSDKPELAQAFLMYAVLVTLLHVPFNMNTRYRITFMDPMLVILGGKAAIAQVQRWSGRNSAVP